MDNSYPDITPTDRDMMIRTVIGEAGNDPSAAGVASVIANRMQQNGQSATQTVLAPGQFEAWHARPNELMSYAPTSPAYQSAAKIVDGIISGQTPDPTNGATKYYAPVAQKALGRQPPVWDNGTGQKIGSQLFFGGKPQTAQAAPSSDFMRDYPISAAPETSAPAASSAPQQGQPSFLTDYPVASPSAPQPSNDQPNQVNGAVRAVGTGVPIIGGLLNKMDAATNAALAPVLNPLFQPGAPLASMGGPLQGDTFGERYQNSLAAQEGMDQSYAAAHPVANTALNIAGGIAGTVPMVMAAPGAFGIGVGSPLVAAGLSGASGAALSAADTTVRSGGDLGAIEDSAKVGGAFGLAAPFAGSLIGSGVNKLSNVFSHTTPAARNVAGILTDIGMTPEAASNALAKMGPNSVPADIDPALTTEASGIAALGGAPTSTLKNAMATRASGADDRMSQLVNDTLGPKPNTGQILNDIRSREISNQVDASTAKAALDTSMGTPADPHAVLQNMMTARSAAAQPLYEKALSNPVVWDKRLQQFLDDPVVQGGLAKGAEIQRLESLANNTPFNPNDYVFMGKGVKNDPNTGRFVSTDIMGNTPNMQTLNVVKKGLDAMVEDAKDPITGRLSQEGVAINGVRGAFLNKLDQINPDYAAARQAWAGPTVTQNAFNRGLNIFRNQSGSAGVDTTPGALSSWINNPATSDSEKDAVKLGVRSAFQQQMASASDPVSQAANLANKQVNQQKLAAILGPKEAQNLAAQLSFKYEDPIGQAFNKGLDVFQNRSGLPGIEDTPDALQSWLKNASPAEKLAHQQGARQAIEQGINGARQGDISAARSLFAKSTANRQKLESVFPNAGGMLDGLDNELRMRAVEQAVAQNSATAERQAVRNKYAPPSGNALGAAPAVIGEAIGGGPGAIALTAAKALASHTHDAITASARNRLIQGTAQGLSSTGPAQNAFMDQVARAYRTNSATNALSHVGNSAANILTRSLGNQFGDAPPLTIHR